MLLNLKRDGLRGHFLTFVELTCVLTLVIDHVRSLLDLFLLKERHSLSVLQFSSFTHILNFKKENHIEGFWEVIFVIFVIANIVMS